MKIRTVIFVVLCSAIWLGQIALDSRVQPQVSTQLAINALNGGNADAANLRTSDQVWNHTDIELSGLTLVAGVLCYGSYLNRALARKGK